MGLSGSSAGQDARCTVRGRVVGVNTFVVTADCQVHFAMVISAPILLTKILTHSNDRKTDTDNTQMKAWRYKGDKKKYWYVLPRVGVDCPA